jgi:hypothetical protein
MNARELVDHIRSSGSTRLILKSPLSFHHGCDFNDFLQALLSNETITVVECVSNLRLGIGEEEWVHLVQCIGRIKSMRSLSVNWENGTSEFHPIQVIDDAVHSARSLGVLSVTSDSMILLQICLVW